MADINFIKYLNDGVNTRKLFTDNPIILHAQQPAEYASLNNLTFFVDIFPENESKITLEGKFVNQECILDISKYLSAFPSFEIPDLLSNEAQENLTNFKLFYIEYGILDENRNELERKTDNVLKPAHLGGVYTDQYADYESFGALPWLSQQPRVKKIKSAHLDYEYFYTYIYSFSSVNIHANIYRKTGPVETKTEAIPFIASIGSFRTVMYPLKKILSNVDLKGVWRIIIDIEQNFVGISDRITYEIDHVKRRNERVFAFQNSLGGLDTITFTGQRTRSQQASKQTRSRKLKYNDKSSANTEKTIKASSKTVFKQETGYLSKEILTYLQREFLVSKEVYEIVNGKFKAVNLLTNKLDHNEDSIKPQSFTIEYSYGL